jgi:hypothetical protein
MTELAFSLRRHPAACRLARQKRHLVDTLPLRDRERRRRHDFLKGEQGNPIVAPLHQSRKDWNERGMKSTGPANGATSAE